MLLTTKERRLAMLQERWIKFLPHLRIQQRSPCPKAKLSCRKLHQSTLSMKHHPSQSSWSRTLRLVQWREKMSCSRLPQTKARTLTPKSIRKVPTGSARKKTAISMATKWTVKTWMSTCSITRFRSKTPLPKVTTLSMIWTRRQSLAKARTCSTWLTIRRFCRRNSSKNSNSSSSSRDLSQILSRKRSANWQ